jgi:hypothetical protein
MRAYLAGWLVFIPLMLLLLGTVGGVCYGIFFLGSWLLASSEFGFWLLVVVFIMSVIFQDEIRNTGNSMLGEK